MLTLQTKTSVGGGARCPPITNPRSTDQWKAAVSVKQNQAGKSWNIECNQRAMLKKS